jgi:hypothetical protein
MQGSILQTKYMVWNLKPMGIGRKVHVMQEENKVLEW